MSLLSQLQSLANQSKKYPDLRDAAEKAQQSSDLDVLLKPFLLCPATKNAKIITQAVAILQRLLQDKHVLSLPQLDRVLSLLKTLANQGLVDVHLKILQTLVSLLSNSTIHGQQLADVLLLCFRLQESKVVAVSSTAAATLRQLVILVFEGVVREDTQLPASKDLEITIDGATTQLAPCAYDAYYVLSDLCRLCEVSGIKGASATTSYIKLPSLPKTFGLELIESILADFHSSLFLTVQPQHPELTHLLRSLLAPMLIRDFSTSQPHFATTARVLRIIFLLLRSFAGQLSDECQIFYRMLIKIISPGDTDGSGGHPLLGLAPTASKSSSEVALVGTSPAWMRLLVLEVVRGLFNDHRCIEAIWRQFDATKESQGIQQSPNGILNSLLSALAKFITERPSLLGVSTAITNGQPIKNGSTSMGFQSADYTVSNVIDSTSAKVADLAVQAASTVGVSAAQAEFGLDRSSIRLQCLDQLDKIEPPATPDTYPFLLALQCLTIFTREVRAVVLPSYQDIIRDRSLADQESSYFAPAPLQAADIARYGGLGWTRSLMETVWTALLSALSYLMTTNADDSLFELLLASYRDCIAICGILDLSLPREAFIGGLAKFAVPPIVVSSVRHPASENSAGPGILSRQLSSLTSSDPINQSLTLSSRNQRCLEMLLDISLSHAGCLSQCWSAILETVQNAEYVLRARANAKRNPREITLLETISSLFSQTSTRLDSDAVFCFLSALSKLACDMVGLPHPGAQTGLAANIDVSKKRASGISTLALPRPGETSFALARLEESAVANRSRLITVASAEPWRTVTLTMIAIMHSTAAIASFRIQAAESLDSILSAVSEHTLSVSDDIQNLAQSSILQCLVQQAGFQLAVINSNVTDVEVRKRAYLSLFKLLETNGHSLACGWSTAFDILTSAASASFSHDAPEKSTNQAQELLAVAFPSMQLICSDFLSALTAQELSSGIDTLFHFSNQRVDLNISLTSSNLLWQVSDHIQSTIRRADNNTPHSELWLYLLKRLARLLSDDRPDMRDGVLQIVFRCLENYGTNLSSADWSDLLEPVLLRPGRHFLQLSLTDPAYSDSMLSWLTGFEALFHNHLTTKLLNSTESSLTSLYLLAIQQLYTTSASIAASAAKSWHALLSKSLSQIKDAATSGAVIILLQDVIRSSWKTWMAIGRSLAETPNQDRSLSQADLEAFVKIANCLLQWPEIANSTKDVKELFIVFELALTWNESDDYRPDIDALSALQSAVLNAIKSVDTSSATLCNLVLVHLSKFSKYAYSRTANDRNTYVALSKLALPLAVSVYLSNPVAALSETQEGVHDLIQAHALPMRLRYKCPPSHRFIAAPQLWQTAALSFLKLAPVVIGTAESPNRRSLVKSLLEAYCGAILADCQPMLELKPVEVRAIEDFDLGLLASLEQEILPSLEDLDVDDIQILPAALQAASRLYHIDIPAYRNRKPESNLLVREARFSLSFRRQAQEPVCGSVSGILRCPRERFAYWSADFLFQACSSKGFSLPGNQAFDLAVLCLPFLLDRASAAIRTYLADVRLLGLVPFPRLRTDEMVYLLQQLYLLELAPGVHATSFPSSSQTPVQELLRDSPAAHLLSVHSDLISLVQLPSSNLPINALPYRLCPAMQATPGLPEGISVGRIGAIQNFDHQPADFWTIQGVAGLCLGRLAAMVDIKVMQS